MPALAERLSAAAASARGPWLMFLRPGVTLDATWVDETARFMEENERETRSSRGRPCSAAHPPLRLRARRWSKRFRSPARRSGQDPGLQQGLVAAKVFYQRVGGHRENADDPEADLIARIGRRRLVMLRSGALDSGR